MPSVHARRAAVLAAALATGLAALLVAGGAAAQSVRGEPLRETAVKRAADDFRAAHVAPFATLRLQPLGAERLGALQRHNALHAGKRLQIGISRGVADEAESTWPAQAAWRAVPGGHVLRFDVVSPGAAALRSALDLSALPEGAELRVASATGGPVERIDRASLAAGVDGSGLYWTPVTDGEAQRLELFVPGDAPRTGAGLQRVSHLVTSPFRPLDLGKALGSSGSCNVDVACRTGALGPAFVNAKNAVARMVFEDGGSFTCTGTLLNDSTPATQVPYFFSAAHCFDSQAAANTLVTFWGYEAPTCGQRSGGANTQVAGGADLLFATLSSDASFMRLRATPPPGAFFAGWNAATLSPSTPVVAIHHPRGDNKKVSEGTHSGFQSGVLIGGQSVTSTARASWSAGTTEGGSSGSGLFTLAGGEYQLRGGLAGGSASCANTGRSEAEGNVDFYSRFDQVYPSLQQWLGTPASAGPTRDHTGAWFVPSESGWGLTVFQFPGQLFALVFVYDAQGRPSWYRLQGAWTGTDTVTAPLDRASGPSWGPSFDPAAVRYTRVGTGTLTFTSPTAATFSFNDGTVNRTVTLQKL